MRSATENLSSESENVGASWNWPDLRVIFLCATPPSINFCAFAAQTTLSFSVSVGGEFILLQNCFVPWRVSKKLVEWNDLLISWRMRGKCLLLETSFLESHKQSWRCFALFLREFFCWYFAEKYFFCVYFLFLFVATFACDEAKMKCFLLRSLAITLIRCLSWLIKCIKRIRTTQYFDVNVDGWCVSAFKCVFIFRKSEWFSLHPRRLFLSSFPHRIETDSQSLAKTTNLLDHKAFALKTLLAAL